MNFFYKHVTTFECSCFGSLNIITDYLSLFSEQEGLKYDSLCMKMDSYMRPPTQKSAPSNSGLPRHHIMTMMTPPPPPSYSHSNQQPPPPPPPPSSGHHHFTIPSRPSFPPRQPGVYHKGRPSKGLSKILAPWKLLNHFG